MAEWKLQRQVAEAGKFPPLCMQCGQPATDHRSRKFTTDQAHIPPLPDEPVGCLILGPLFGLLKLVSWASAKTMVVTLPLCHRHAHGWFNWSAVEAKAITDEEIVLKNVSGEFIQAWEDQAALASADIVGDKTTVKIRCRNCQTLNPESARFCNQCGDAL